MKRLPFLPIIYRISYNVKLLICHLDDNKNVPVSSSQKKNKNEPIIKKDTFTIFIFCDILYLDFEVIKMLNDFEIELCARKNTKLMPKTHFHDAYELYYLLAGNIQYFIEDNVYILKKGDMVCIPSKTLHKTQTLKCPDHTRILIYFTKEFIKEFLAYNPNLLDFFQKKFISIPKQKQEKIENILHTMLNEYQQKRDIIMLKSLMGELLVTLDRYSTENEAFRTLSDVKSDKILEVVRYINQEYASNISLDLLSKKFYMCPSYLSRSFKKVTGFTYIEYLNKVRIKQATYLLLNTTKNITTIAEEVGFSSANHFCKTFKSIVGISPLKYRKSF